MTTHKSTRKVVLEGRGPLSLRPSDHVATGGEGSIFRANDTVVKIYTDPKKMQKDGMVEKIKLLSTLKHDYIVSPKGSVTLPDGTPVGYYMTYVEGEPFSRVFTNDFRQREGFQDKDVFILVDRMRDTVQYAHDAQAIMVDANELNWLATLANKKKNGPEPRVIDVDSWAIGKWPATVIMPSIRDWHAKHFDEMSDWFSWGIVSFQLYTGIHPYKGKIDGFRIGDLEGRMKANVSIFSKGVKLNRAVRDFSCIPGKLLDWYVAMFEHGERTIPPSPFDTGVATFKAAIVKRIVAKGDGQLVFEKIYSETRERAVRVFPCGVVLLESGRIIDIGQKREIGKATSLNCEVVKVKGGWLKVERGAPRFSFSHINSTNFKETILTLPISAREVVRYENRLFAVTEQGLTELMLTVFGKPILTVGNTWGAVVNSTRWFNGVGVQDTMGAMYLIVPFGDTSCAQVRVRELDSLKPVASRAGNRFVTVMAVNRKGEYLKFEFSFNKDYSSYSLWQGKSDSPELNIAILPKGVCATIVNDGELDIFVPSSGVQNKVVDKNIATDMTLFNWGDLVVYVQNGEVWSVHVT